jgi:hypothetical protein
MSPAFRPSDHSSTSIRISMPLPPTASMRSTSRKKNSNRHIPVQFKPKSSPEQLSLNTTFATNRHRGSMRAYRSSLPEHLCGRAVHGRCEYLASDESCTFSPSDCAVGATGPLFVRPGASQSTHINRRGSEPERFRPERHCHVTGRSVPILGHDD